MIIYRSGHSLDRAMNHSIKQKSLHFHDCSSQKKLGNYVLVRQQHMNFLHGVPILLLSTRWDFMALYGIRTPRNILHAWFTREEDKIIEQGENTFCRSLCNSLVFARGILKQNYLPPYDMNSAPKVNFCGNPRPGLQLKPVQHSFLCTASNQDCKMCCRQFYLLFWLYRIQRP